MASMVYVLTNEGMPGLLKIGKTDRDNPGHRMNELYTTGVPFPFECVKAIEMANNEQAKELEQALHQAFVDRRVNSKREFFRIREEQVLAILDVWPSGKDATPRAQQEAEAGMEEAEREAIKQVRLRRPPLDFVDLGIPIGAILKFINLREGTGESTESIEAEVVDNRRVLFRGEEMYLTRATLRALGEPDDKPIRPAPFWSYKDRMLDDLYEELHGQS